MILQVLERRRYGRIVPEDLPLLPASWTTPPVLSFCGQLRSASWALAGRYVPWPDKRASLALRGRGQDPERGGDP